MKVSLFLRKKRYGQNSIEEIAYDIASSNEDVSLKTFPEATSSLKNIIANIKYARANKGDVNLFYQPSEAYCTWGLKNSIVTYHDIGTLVSRSRLKTFLLKVLIIWIPEFCARKLVCISEFTKKELTDSLLIKKHASKIVLIYQGYKRQLTYSPKEYNTSNPVILHVGTAERKNLSTVIKALEGSKFHLDIVGELSLEQKELLEKTKIDYTNYVDLDYSELVKLYQKCDIVTFPSSYEGFGMIVIEANVIGRCVITSSIPVIKEIAGDGSYFVEDPLDVQELKDAISKIDSDSTLREELICRGRKNAERFTMQNLIDSYNKLYTQL